MLLKCFTGNMDSTRYIGESRKEEYQMQHFEFSSSQFTHEGKEAIMSVIEEAAAALERTLVVKYPTAGYDTIHKATQNLIKVYSVAVKEWATSFSERMDDMFMCIPSSILLDEDKPQEKQYSKEEVENFDVQLEELERKLIGAKFMEVKLKNALRSSEKALEQRSGHIHVTPSVDHFCDILMKEIDKTDQKRRKYHEMAPIMEQEPPQKKCGELSVSSGVETLIK